VDASWLLAGLLAPLAGTTLAGLASRFSERIPR
jgi:hypothetical protein